MDGVQDRPYQRAFVDGDEQFPGVIRAWGGGDPAVLGLLPTGCGKTVCAGMIARRLRDDHGHRTLFLAHREELIYQAAGTIGRFGLTTGIEMADQRASDLSLFDGVRPDVVVGTVQSMQKTRLRKWDRQAFGAIITDECHHARAQSYKNVYDHFRDAYHLGITATPDRGDGRNLGAIYSRIAYEYTLRQAILDGWLVPLLTLRLPCGVSLQDIKATGGDYADTDLAARIGPHIEALCDIMIGEIGTRQTVVFTPDVASAEATADCLTQMGVPARAVSGRMAKVDRKQYLAEYAAGTYQVIVCCDVLVEGWDNPPTSCVVVMRPTRKRNRYAQMIGRGTRRFPGKDDCLIVDFAWETTSAHELVVPTDLFDDSQMDDEVAEIAADLVAQGKERDPMAAIDRAETIHRERVTMKIRLTGKRTHYRKFVFDPVNVGALIGLPIKQSWDFNPQNPATTKQLDALRRLGIRQPEGLSKQGAGKCIEALVKRCRDKLATVAQVQYLIGLGVEPAQARQMTFEFASATLDELTKKRVG